MDRLLRIGGPVLVGIPTKTWPFQRRTRCHSFGSETIVATHRYSAVGTSSKHILRISQNNQALRIKADLANSLPLIRNYYS
jgi:hypothetical protein